MTTLNAGDPAPNFSLPNQSETVKTLADYSGKNLIIFVYPKANTPGCKKEAQDFTRLASDFAKFNMEIVGLSKDSPKKQQSFIDKAELGVDLLSDESGDTLVQYGAWGLKKNYGKEYEGIIRSTFIIDSNGKILQAFYNVKATGHAERVLKWVQEQLS